MVAPRSHALMHSARVAPVLYWPPIAGLPAKQGIVSGLAVRVAHAVASRRHARREW